MTWQTQRRYLTLAGLALVACKRPPVAEIAPRPTRAAVQVVASGDSTCTVLDDGQPRCWGGSFLVAGEREDDQGVNQGPNTSFDVAVRELVLGDGHVCALLVDAKVRCWGHDTGGSTGWGEALTFDDAKARPALELGADALAIASGKDHACALLEGGSVRCWGFGGRPGPAALSPSAGDRRPSEIPVLELPGPATGLMAAGPSTCVELAGADQRCFGSDGNDRIVFLPLRDLRVRQFAVQDLFDACMVDSEGRVRCWSALQRPLGLGWAEAEGWADATTGLITLAKPAKQVSHGDGFACALLDGGEVYCWGRSDRGALGRGVATTGIQAPARVELGGPARSIASGDAHSCALLESGSLRCWGANDEGQLGYPHRRDIGDDETPAAAGDVPLG